MRQAKTIFIIPGFRQRPTSKAYKEIVKILKKAGFFPILVAVPWKNSTISQNTTYFLKIYKKNKSKNKYVLGFSYGAMIAFIAATRVSVSGLILCSLSPYFREDITKLKQKATTSLMIERYRDFTKLHCETLAKQIKAKQVLMLYGREETRSLIRRVIKTFRKVASPHKHLFPVKKTEHNIGDKRYLQQIFQVAQNFL